MIDMLELSAFAWHCQCTLPWLLVGSKHHLPENNEYSLSQKAVLLPKKMRITPILMLVMIIQKNTRLYAEGCREIWHNNVCSAHWVGFIYKPITSFKCLRSKYVKQR